MNSIKLQKSASDQPCFGMPISGHASGVTTAVADVRTTTTVVRERVAATGLAQAYFPGTSAWRPPSC